MSTGLLFEIVDHFPDLLALHALNPQRYPCLLESVAHGTSQARYDILFAFPGERITLDTLEPGTDFLAQLDQTWQQHTGQGLKDTHLPFRGGWFVYLGYELAGQIEPSLQLPTTSTHLPVAFALRIPAAVIRDHATGRCWLVSEAEHAHLDSMRADIDAVMQQAPAVSAPVALQLEEEAAPRYLKAVERIKRYIVDGDVFQVNLSREWSGKLEHHDDIALYDSLRRNNPAPFAGLVRLDDFAIISSSPERLVCIEGRHVETRPIAGTRPRGEARDSDDANSRELLAHPKERAEHIMLIDLERNDLGRVCQPGSIEVNELMVLESYAHVHHIVSNVRGELRDGISPGDVIRAVFPGGTITGCPKVRCMEIIAELEQTPRGAYTGSMGYLNRDGDMDLNILIRTITREASTIKLRAGAGIVADSIAERELDETRAKARGMLLALHDRGEG
ncbi:MAG: aminodeoxychorismate synthase component I [Granulosicoccaceae bacterium]|jgi:anthranilate synthase component 1